MAQDLDLTVVTMVFDGGDQAGPLGQVLARYVVLSRTEPGCRNVDLCHSRTRPGRFLVVEKWESPKAHRAHLDAEATVRMAEQCRALGVARPEVDAFDAISAHDLR